MTIPPFGKGGQGGFLSATTKANPPLSPFAKGGSAMNGKCEYSQEQRRHVQ
jgi:hypothetical protein